MKIKLKQIESFDISVIEGMSLEKDGTFYGFKQNFKTGAISYDAIDDGTLIVLNDYIFYFWSTASMTFSISASGHLQVGVT